MLASLFTLDPVYCVYIYKCVRVLVQGVKLDLRCLNMVWQLKNLQVLQTSNDFLVQYMCSHYITLYNPYIIKV